MSGRYVINRVKERASGRGHVQIQDQNSMGTSVKGMLQIFDHAVIMNVKVSVDMILR